MRSLYTMTSNKAATRDVARPLLDSIGNMPAPPRICPDDAALIVFTGEVVSVSWSWRGGECPPPTLALEEDRSRRDQYPHQAPALVPLISFNENECGPDGQLPPVLCAEQGQPPSPCLLGSGPPGPACGS